MKIKNIFGYIGLMLVMGLTLTACTQEDEMLSGNRMASNHNYEL